MTRTRRLLAPAFALALLAACGDDSTTAPPPPPATPAQSSNGITVQSPNGGETFKVGDKIPVSWTFDNASFTSAKAMIDCGSKDWFLLATSSFDPSIGDTTLAIPDSVYSSSAKKLIPFPVGNTCKVKISDYTLTSILDTSDANFTVLAK